MQIGIVELVEVGAPSRRPACLFDHIFKTLASAFRHKAEQRLSVGSHRRAYGAESRILLGNPVERVEGDDLIEFLSERQDASVCDFESKVGPYLGIEVARSEGDHIPSAIVPYHRTPRTTSGYSRRDLAVAADAVD